MQRTLTWRHFAAIGGLVMLGACAQPMAPPPSVASNPPPTAPGPNAAWYTVSFDSGSFAIGPDGQAVIAQVSAALQSRPGSVATIIGRTDTVGTKDYNMRLSHRRADSVRDALVYNSNVTADRVETRWTGERRQNVPTGNEVAAAANRVVDIAVH